MKIFGFFLLITLLALGAGGTYGYSQLTKTYQGYANEKILKISNGMGVDAIGKKLAQEGLIQKPWMFRLIYSLFGRGKTLKAGMYRFDRPMTPREILEKLIQGEFEVVSITFPEGLTIAQMAQIFQSKGMGSAESFVQAAQGGELIHDLDPDATSLEGYLFPDTYYISPQTSPDTLQQLMLERFRQVFRPEWQAQLELEGLSVHRMVTLASLIEKETDRDEERSMVSAVFHNRLQQGMRLQCDPTVIYGLSIEEKFDGNLTKNTLKADSPYNTYVHEGLPPGPIASPGQASLEAAMHPASVSYLFFVSRNDGSHAFSTDYKEHVKNVDRFQIQFFRDKRRDLDPTKN
jgi:UPF0755 protein